MITPAEKTAVETQLQTIYAGCLARISHLLTPEARYRKATDYLDAKIGQADFRGVFDQAAARDYAGAMAFLQVAAQCHDRDAGDMLTAALRADQ